MNYYNNEQKCLTKQGEELCGKNKQSKILLFYACCSTVIAINLSTVPILNGIALGLSRIIEIRVMNSLRATSSVTYLTLMDWTSIFLPFYKEWFCRGQICECTFFFNNSSFDDHV